MKYTEIKGDLIQLALSGTFDVICHGVNCMCIMGAGLAPQMAKTFGCDSYSLEHKQYKGDINKLGQIDYKEMFQEKPEYSGKWVHYPDHESFMTGKELYIVNAYTQYDLGKNLDYNALILCLRKMNHIFKGKHIGLPQIGCGIAGGNWDVVKELIQINLKNCDVTVVIYGK